MARVLEAIWDFLTTVINAVIETVESIAGWFLSGFSLFILFLLMIPILGRIIKWILNIAITAVWGLLGIIDFLLNLVGVKPEKKLRISMLVLRDSSGNLVASDSDLVTHLQHAIDIFFEQANVRVIRSGPLNYDSGFAGKETADTNWFKEMLESSANNILDVACGVAAAGEDLWIPGVKFEYLAGIRMYYGNFRRLIGYGAPIPIFVVRDSGSSSTLGCSLGPLADYVTIEGGNPICIAHEMGHACNLWHAGDSSNLMNSRCGGTQLSRWQVALLRSSRHVTYF